MKRQDNASRKERKETKKKPGSTPISSQKRMIPSTPMCVFDCSAQAKQKNQKQKGKEKETKGKKKDTKGKKERDKGEKRKRQKKTSIRVKKVFKTLERKTINSI